MCPLLWMLVSLLTRSSKTHCCTKLSVKRTRTLPSGNGSALPQTFPREVPVPLPWQIFFKQSNTHNRRHGVVISKNNIEIPEEVHDKPFPYFSYAYFCVVHRLFVKLDAEHPRAQCSRALILIWKFIVLGLLVCAPVQAPVRTRWSTNSSIPSSSIRP